MEQNKFNLKTFDLNAAKQGKPVCTRDGRKARIVCMDAKGAYPIIALVYDGIAEDVFSYMENGKFSTEGIDKNDLFIFAEKKNGWVNVYKSVNGKHFSNSIYASLEEALRNKENGCIGRCVDTVKIEWEE